MHPPARKHASFAESLGQEQACKARHVLRNGAIAAAALAGQESRRRARAQKKQTEEQTDTAGRALSVLVYSKLLPRKSAKFSGYREGTNYGNRRLSKASCGTLGTRLGTYTDTQALPVIRLDLCGYHGNLHFGQLEPAKCLRFTNRAAVGKTVPRHEDNIQNV